MKKILTSLGLLFTITIVSADDITFTVVKTTLGNKVGSIDLSINGGVAPYVYSWQGPSGFTANTEDINALAEGKYTITVTDKYCGIATATVNVDVNSTGIADLSNQSFSIFPNPTTGQLNIVSNTSLNKATIQLTNAIGEMVIEKKGYSGNNLYLDIAAITPGVYFIQIINQGNISRKKVFKN